MNKRNKVRAGNIPNIHLHPMQMVFLSIEGFSTLELTQELARRLQIDAEISKAKRVKELAELNEKFGEIK